MIFTFKSLSGQTFSLDIDPSTPVREVIQQISVENGQAPDTISLLYSGRPLNDKDAPISSINYDPTKYIIIFRNKNKKEGNQSTTQTNISKSSQPVKAENNQTSQSSKEEQKEPENPPKEAATAENKQENKEETNPETEKRNFEESVQNMVEMGFDRSTVVEALHRANGSQNMALEIVLSHGGQLYGNSQRRQEQEQQINERRRFIHSIRTTPAPKCPKFTSVTALPGFSIAKKRQISQDVKDMHSNFYDDNNETLESIDRVIQRRGLHLLDAIRNNRVPLITMLGFRVIYNGIALSISPFAEVIDDTIISALGIPEEDIPAITRLARTGFNIQAIYNIYRENNRDESQTREILEMIMNGFQY